MLNVLGQEGKVLCCPNCMETEKFNCPAKEHHTWAVDQYGQFHDDVGCNDTEQIHEFRCAKCDTEADWVNDTSEEQSPPNENVLAGMRCPKCKQNKKLLIAVEAMMAVTDDGTDPFDDTVNDKDYEWDEESYCRCPECGYKGVVKVFQEK